MINIQKSILFAYSSDKQSDIEIYENNFEQHQNFKILRNKSDERCVKPVLRKLENSAERNQRRLKQ